MSIPKKSKQAATQKAPRAKKTAGKAPKKVAKKAVKAPPKKRVSAPTGAKRSAEELTTLKASIDRTVALTPGLTAEEVAKSLSTTTKALAMPLRQMRASKVLSTTGTRRFLRYYPKGAAPKASKAKSAAKKAA